MFLLLVNYMQDNIIMIFHWAFEGNLSAQHMAIIFFFKTMKANGINRKCIPKKNDSGVRSLRVHVTELSVKDYKTFLHPKQEIGTHVNKEKKDIPTLIKRHGIM